MFEFHGWATIRVAEPERSDFKPIGRGTEVDAIKRVRAAINDAHDEFSLFDVRQTSNNMIVLLAHGLRKHRFEPVIGLFRWLAAELPDSYGCCTSTMTSRIRTETSSECGGSCEGTLRNWMTRSSRPTSQPWKRRVNSAANKPLHLTAAALRFFRVQLLASRRGR